MRTIVFFLEEPSAREMLKGILPRLLPEDFQIRYLVFQGKQDLEKNLKRRLRGWRLPDSVFVVMRDQDSGDCRAIKARLVDLCREAGSEGALVRVACRELESFYLGDLAAVERGLGIKGLDALQDKAKYRNPDELVHPAEELDSLTRKSYHKLAGSRAIAPHLTLGKNHSHSFNVLLSGIRRLVGQQDG